MLLDESERAPRRGSKGKDLLLSPQDLDTATSTCHRVQYAQTTKAKDGDDACRVGQRTFPSMQQ
jgi:hypothetical protein